VKSTLPRPLGLHPLDVAAQAWMIATSHRFHPDQVRWLAGPTAGVARVGHDWVARTAAELRGSTTTGPELGLLPRFDVLAGRHFDPDAIDPLIVDFYQHTSCWRLDLWSQWSAVAWPFGRLLVALWSNRLQQLSLPLHPLDVSFGMDSSVVHVLDGAGQHAGSAWLRTMRKTGATTYSGLYGVATLPGSDQPSVRVTFPLPLGSLPVFLRPEARQDGSLLLRSPIAPFGGDGSYLVLQRRPGSVYARKIPIAETFHVYVDGDGDLRTDHAVSLWSIPVLRLHYRMRRDDAAGAAAEPRLRLSYEAAP
jgi:hypothetical protein